MTLNDPKPQKQKILVFCCNFWLRRTFQKWISPKLLEMVPDNLHMEFLAYNVYTF